MNRDELLAWWLGELDSVTEERLDAHVFACADCAVRLTALLALGDAIRRETLSGSFGFVVPAAFVGRLHAAGLRLREYTLEPGGSVNCTIGPGDDFVVSHLHA
ncbi:MAG: zf-HC2 domain-containing protein, partial [Gammaproteobacteria bacterium]|nr:zf-HC2 domain-containing protein [Gammaproteobacteria bacterium]